MRTLYAPIEPYRRGWLSVGDGHEVYFEENLQFFEGRRENKADGIPPWESFERLTITSVRQIFGQFSDPDQKWAKKYVKLAKLHQESREL